jgi:hypothetical protein
VGSSVAISSSSSPPICVSSFSIYDFTISVEAKRNEAERRKRE